MGGLNLEALFKPLYYKLFQGSQRLVVQLVSSQTFFYIFKEEDSCIYTLHLFPFLLSF